jgi:molybdate transport system substrate-binding protein
MMRVMTLILLGLCGPVAAEDALVGVATNFMEVVTELRDQFEAESGHDISLAGGSSGKLYAQILNGAPFDVFLSADRDLPERIEQSAFGVAGTRFTYAVGRLVLWSARAELVRDDLQTTLLQEGIIKLAIANPALAPYGVASREALQSSGVWDLVSAKIVMGENVAQAAALVGTGNADVGLIALSFARRPDRPLGGRYIVIPEDLHSPVSQDAILLKHGEDNRAAREFLAFLQGEYAAGLMQANGYEVL